MPVSGPGAGMPGLEGGQLQPKPTDMTKQFSGQLADMSASVDNLREMLPQTRDKLGLMRGAGVRGSVGQYLGTDQDLVALRNEAKRLFDLVYIKSGKQINEREMGILKSYLPDINQHPDVFAANLERFAKTLEAIKKARGLGAPSSGPGPGPGRSSDPSLEGITSDLPGGGWNPPGGRQGPGSPGSLGSAEPDFIWDGQRLVPNPAKHQVR